MKKTLLVLGLIWSFNMAYALNSAPLIIKSETKDLVSEIKYPQDFANQNINEEIKKEVGLLEKENMPEVDSSLPPEIPGKNGLYIDYKIAYQNDSALSILFSISSFTRGAAHPNNLIHSLNFIDGKKVELAQLFKKDADFLPIIADICKENLLKKDFSNKDLVISGTKPSAENYQNWTFNKDGLQISFTPYQVAAYVYGVQDVLIPKDKINSLLLPEIAKALWGN